MVGHRCDEHTPAVPFGVERFSCRRLNEYDSAESGAALGADAAVEKAPLKMRRMSALGQKQTHAVQQRMSAFPPKADIGNVGPFSWPWIGVHTQPE